CDRAANAVRAVVKRHAVARPAQKAGPGAPAAADQPAGLAGGALERADHGERCGARVEQRAEAGPVASAPAAERYGAARVSAVRGRVRFEITPHPDRPDDEELLVMCGNSLVAKVTCDPDLPGMKIMSRHIDARRTMIDDEQQAILICFEA